MQGGYFKTKKIHVFVNGRDQYKSFNIHPRCRSGWNTLLDWFSRALNPPFGAIRVLRTADGKKTVNSFDEIDNEGKYVACGLESYKSIKGGYRTYSETHLKLRPTEYYPAETLGEEDQKKYPCLIETMKRGRTIIYVFANGKKLPPRKVVLIKSDYEAWESILSHIAIFLDIPEGVKGMYTVFGQPLCSPHEIQHGGYYVAIPFNAKFKQIKYLPVRRAKSYHETSPMITKDVYISAAKTCTSIDIFHRKRRKGKNAHNELSSDEHDHLGKQIDQSLIIEGEPVERRIVVCNCSCRLFNKKRPKRDVKHKTIHKPSPLEKIPSQLLQSHNIDEENMENLTDVTANVTNDFTQTSTLFLEANCDTDNELIMNERKYFLISEEKLKLLTGSSKEDKSHDDESPTYAEIEELARSIVGMIITTSEIIANRTVFGESSSELPSEKVDSLIEEFEPIKTEKTVSMNPSVTDSKKSALASDKQKFSERRALRLSVPIGRDMVRASEIIAALDKDYEPLTPAHEPEEKKIEVENDSHHRISRSFSHLKRDSIGSRSQHEVVEAFSTKRKSSDESSASSKGDIEEDGEMEQEYDWNKLDILDDMDLDSSEESVVNIEEESKRILEDEELHDKVEITKFVSEELQYRLGCSIDKQKGTTAGEEGIDSLNEKKRIREENLEEEESQLDADDNSCTCVSCEQIVKLRSDLSTGKSHSKEEAIGLDEIRNNENISSNVNADNLDQNNGEVDNLDGGSSVNDSTDESDQSSDKANQNISSSSDDGIEEKHSNEVTANLDEERRTQNDATIEEVAELVEERNKDEVDANFGKERSTKNDETVESAVSFEETTNFDEDHSTDRNDHISKEVSGLNEENSPDANAAIIHSGEDEDQGTDETIELKTTTKHNTISCDPNGPPILIFFKTENVTVNFTQGYSRN